MTNPLAFVDLGAMCVSVTASGLTSLKLTNWMIACCSCFIRARLSGGT